MRRALIVLFALLTTVLITPPADAQAPQMFGRSRSADQPIDISADALEVLQNQQVAIFTGRVEAIQGDLRLKADRLKVFYSQRSASQPSTAPAKPAAANAPGAGPNQAEAAGSIRRIEASGNVFVSSPTETAQGDKGDYDVDKKTILLEGNVILTKGQNVLRGQKATMDMNTGVSSMAPTPGQRVRGLFVPERGQQPGGPPPDAGKTGN